MCLMPVPNPAVSDDLIDHVAATAGLPPGAARRVIEDVLAHYAEGLAEFVARRHGELAAAGCRNPEIFRRLCEEIAGRPFARPACTERQIRRMIYG